MVDSAAMLFTAATLAMVAFPPTTVAESKDLQNVLSQLQNAVRPRHCGHLRHAGQTSSGVYTIYPKAESKSGQRVYCDMETDGGDWTVIQRRGQYGNNIFYFRKNWDKYASGFGDPEEEYWIDCHVRDAYSGCAPSGTLTILFHGYRGNQHGACDNPNGNYALHALTSGAEQMTLRVVLNNNTKIVTVDYGRFKISSEHENFSISVGDYEGPEGWDTMTEVSGLAFSTFDRNSNQDGNSFNCAYYYNGASWHKYPCVGPNLNGVNFNGAHDFPGDGIHWKRSGKNSEGLEWELYSYPSVHMMIRPTRGLSNRRRR